MGEVTLDDIERRFASSADAGSLVGELRRILPISTRSVSSTG
jgi:hypothetical protein